ncbi:MAG: TIGR03013 family PEP-CTERM/XrtA system glycosyltransferase [Elioraea sp.]|nr:TIGR03013 family PEP-CTERM/XrtA system glycosyltransferase [Elioraea sp.]MDW8445572.1 TIGR03013 family PEP-CTERM/XrtA system glycosyltransferase [Acetobacteraceae bacterium]
MILRNLRLLSAGTALFLVELALLAVAWPLAAGVALSPLPPERRAGLVPLALFAALYLLFAYATGLYRREALLETRRSLGRVPIAAGLGSMVAAAPAAFLPPPFAAEGSATLFAVALIVFSLAGWAARVLMFALIDRGAFRRRILVIGAGEKAWELAFLMRREGRAVGMEITFVHHPALGRIDPRLANDPEARIVTTEDGFVGIAREIDADQVVVAPDERRGMPMAALLACRTGGFPVYEFQRFLEKEIGRVDMKRLDYSWLLYADGFTFTAVDLFLKRALDIAVSTILLFLTLPMLVGAGLAIKLEDGGPILYRQARVTKGGRVFKILKLRTMYQDAERSGAMWAQKGDPRVTRIGRFLRRMRIDELPQLINVLKGDMSFVGPRPERPEFVRELAEQLPLYNERHLVRAGLTGWAQINYPYGASLDDARSKLSYDLFYVKNFSVLFDVLIIIQTLRVVLWPGGGVR